MRALRRYGVLLRLPGALRAVAPALLARSSYAMGGLALLLFVHARTGSYARAGLVVGLYSFAAAATSPLLGWAVDRFGALPVLGAAALVYPATLLALLAAPAHGWLPLGVAVLAGGVRPPTGPAMRALWPALTGDLGLITIAYNFESVLVETVFVFGPLLVGLLVATAGPAAAVIATAGAMTVGTLGYVTAPAVRYRPRSPHPRARGGPLASPGVRAVLAVVALLAGSFGVIEVTVAGFATAHGSSARSGPLLALWALGSFTGGLWYGGRHWSGTPVQRYLWLLPIIGVTMLPLALAGSIPVLAVLLFVTGLAIAPTGTEEFTLVARHTPAGNVTESFTWVNMLLGVGASAGTAAGGTLVSHDGTTPAFLLAGALALGAAGLAVLTRHRMALPTGLASPVGVTVPA
ncbi:MAG: hypothetical protein ACYDAQ_21315 [Mycobacteriales bacterium]